MLYITLIDDDIKALTHLQAELNDYLKKQNIDFFIKTFQSGLDFLANPPVTDILFLDVEMPGMNGIDVAKEVRKTNSEMVILFCTNYRQFAINGYEVNALGYMVKPIEAYSLSANMQHALLYLEEKKAALEKKIELHAYQSIIILPLKDLVYIEVKKHNLFYNLKDDSDYPEKVLKIRGTMNNIYESLRNDNFEKCGNSFLINLDYVVSVKGDVVTLKNKATLPLSRLYKENFMSVFTKYLVKKGSIVL